MAIHVCDHCGKPIPSDASVCPYCGEEISEDIRLTRIPETIDELRAFCAAHRMPLDAMRFFIGEDFKGAKAFGIFKREDGTCVVYKNKADGSRAVRYEGPDEKHAVREIYEKLKSETELRFGPGESSSRSPSADVDDETPDGQPLKPWEWVVGTLALIWKPAVIVLVAALLLFHLGKKPDRGYYRYQDETYYYQGSDWYLYNALLDDWEQTGDVPERLEEDYDEYYESEDYRAAYGTSDFSDSEYYYEDSSYSSESSYDDYDWDSSDFSLWDSSDTDWDSDW
ncbi:MAG: zinc-ribbon domain-containing protein [Oscillospiraceae bacterium]|nr:zinc-ribbon domain-containing protein [Oscillospiraceae bacterium]